MNLAPLVSAFVLILITELGDKTMFAVLTMSSKHSRVEVLAGALGALASVTVLGVLMGEVIFQFVARFWLEIGAAALFLGFGAYTLLTRGKMDEGGLRFQQFGGSIATFGMVALMELGDKSQISVIALAAESGEAGMVFLGTMIAFAIITTAMVLIGDQLGKRISQEHIRIGSGVIFIIFGLVFLIQALLS